MPDTIRNKAAFLGVLTRSRARGQLSAPVSSQWWRDFIQSITDASSDLPAAIVTAGGGGGGGEVNTASNLGGGVANFDSKLGVDLRFNSFNALDFSLAANLLSILDSGIDHGSIAGLLDDDHTQYVLLAGRSGGQSVFGSPTNAENISIGGNPGANPGFINADSPIIFGPYQGNPAAAYGFSYTQTENFPGVFIGGGLNFSGIISHSSTVFIYESFRGSPQITSNANDGFRAYTVLQALPLMIAGSGAGHNPLAPLIINAGATLENPFVGTRTTVNSFGMNFGPQTRATIAFATMAVTNQTAISCRPTFSTINLATASLGTIRGVHQQNPGVALFQPQAGVETMVANVAVDVDNIAFGGNVTKAAVRSAQAAATNAFFLLQTGTAQSRLLGQLTFLVDTIGITFGISSDVQMGWAGASNEWFMQFNALVNQYRIGNPSAGRFLFDSPIADHEFNFNCNRFSLGAQTGAVGNQIGVFVAPAVTHTIAGDFSQFLMTSAGNITVDANGDIFGWTINAPGITAGTGTVVTAAALNVGGNPGVATTNRVGLRIISNPSGGSGVNAALWVTAGLSRFDGRVDINNGVALGGGAAATLGTIGGVGPTAAAQAQWVEIDIGGTAHWIPAWV